MKAILLVVLSVIISGCTVGQMNDQIFSYFEDYTREKNSDDSLVIIESTQKQKMLWVYADVYLDVYEGCAKSKKSEGYLGAIKVSSNPEIGLIKEAYLPSNKELYFSLGEYQSEVSCGANFKLSLDSKEKYKFKYTFNPGKGCDIEVLVKEPESETYKPSKDVKYLTDNGYGSYRKEKFRMCSTNS